MVVLSAVIHRPPGNAAARVNQNPAQPGSRGSTAQKRTLEIKKVF
jgi:hypothetical protein